MLLSPRSDVIDPICCYVGNDVTNQLLKKRKEYVTDVIVTWSDVIDHIELLVEGLMLSHYL